MGGSSSASFRCCAGSGCPERSPSTRRAISAAPSRQPSRPPASAPSTRSTSCRRWTRSRRRSSTTTRFASAARRSTRGPGSPEARSSGLAPRCSSTRPVAWHRWKLGWLDRDQVVCLTRRGSVQARLQPVESRGGTKAIVVRLARAVVVAEVRQRIAEDRRLCAKGVLFYRVDFAGAPGPEGGSVNPVRLLQARAGSSQRCGSSWRAAFDLGSGHVSRARAWGVALRVVRAHADGSYTVRLTRT